MNIHGICLAAVAGLVLMSGALASTDRLAYQTQIITLGGEQYRMRIPSGYVLELLTDEVEQRVVPVVVVLQQLLERFERVPWFLPVKPRLDHPRQLTLWMPNKLTSTPSWLPSAPGC